MAARDAEEFPGIVGAGMRVRGGNNNVIAWYSRALFDAISNLDGKIGGNSDQVADDESSNKIPLAEDDGLSLQRIFSPG